MLVLIIMFEKLYSDNLFLRSQGNTYNPCNLQTLFLMRTNIILVIPCKRYNRYIRSLNAGTIAL